MSNRPESPSRSQIDQQSKPKIKRWVTSIILLPILFVTLLALVLAYRIHAGNKEVADYAIDPVNAPSNRTSILIFSPHPDDETLGTGGLIQETLKAGGKVHVVFMTNGDAFRVGVASYFKLIDVKPSDFIRYGEMRQGEALAALKTLGLPASDVTFLGYPDRGLMGMWETSWTPSDPWQSHYSRANVNPYPNAPSYGKPYCGENVLGDIQAQIVADHPTDIYVTHPTDDHPDHSASASFVIAAVHALEAEGAVWVSQVHVHFFLIHRGDWPVPQGYYPTLAAGPPAAFIRLDTDWRTLALDGAMIRTKKLALDHYVSQEEMMSRFLVSFIRRNEVFGDLPETSEQASLKEPSGGQTASMEPPSPASAVAKDPIGDSVLREFQPGGDVKEVFATNSSREIYITVEYHSRLNRDIDYKLTVRPFDKSMNSTPSVSNYTFTPRSLPEGAIHRLSGGIALSWNGSTAQYEIPRQAFGVTSPPLIFVQATTTFSQVPVDHTGYRPVFVSWDSPAFPPS